jgi:hypothetical protein
LVTRLPKNDSGGRQRVRVYLTSDQVETLQKQASNLGLSLSAFCSQLLLEKPKIFSPSDATELKQILKDIRSELTHFSGYTNQIAKATNINREFKVELQKDWKTYRDATIKIAEFFKEYEL